MNVITVSDRMQDVFRTVFNDQGLVLTEETTAHDIPGWDSLAHVGLMFSLEAEFGITFSDTELAGLGDVGALRAVIERKAA